MALATAITQAADQSASHWPKPAALTATDGSKATQIAISMFRLQPDTLRRWRTASTSSSVAPTETALMRLMSLNRPASGLASASRYRYGGV
jgi:hypothetical protein